MTHNTSKDAARLPRCPSCGSEYPALRYFMVGNAIVCTDFFHSQPTKDAAPPQLNTNFRTLQRLIISGDEPLFPAMITYSAPMKIEELNDFEDVLKIWLRQLRRNAVHPVEPPAPPAASTGQPKTSPVGKMGSSGYLVTLPDEKPAAMHPEDLCQQCGGPNPTWFAPNETWNRVVPNPVGILCPNCFLKRARAAGIVCFWELRPEQTHPVRAFASEQTADLQREKAELERQLAAWAAIGHPVLDAIEGSPLGNLGTSDPKPFIERIERWKKAEASASAAEADNARLREELRLWKGLTALAAVPPGERPALAAVPPGEQRPCANLR